MAPYLLDLIVIATSCIALGLSISALMLNHDTRDRIERCATRHAEEKERNQC